MWTEKEDENKVFGISFKTMAAETRVNEVVGNNGLQAYTCCHTHLELV